MSRAARSRARSGYGTTSSSRFIRSPRGGRARPYWRCSSSNQPAPRPTSTRPFEIRSTVVAILARSDGWRKVLAVTISPPRIRRDWARSAVRMVQPSSSGSAMSFWFRRWSWPQAVSKPRRSASSQASRISAYEPPIWATLIPKRNGLPGTGASFTRRSRHCSAQDRRGLPVGVSVRKLLRPLTARAPLPVGYTSTVAELKRPRDVIHFARYYDGGDASPSGSPRWQSAPRGWWPSRRFEAARAQLLGVSVNAGSASRSAHEAAAATRQHEDRTQMRGLGRRRPEANLSKLYRSWSLVVDEQEFRRLVDECQRALAEEDSTTDPTPMDTNFSVEFSDGLTFRLESLDAVLAEENPRGRSMHGHPAPTQNCEREHRTRLGLESGTCGPGSP